MEAWFDLNGARLQVLAEDAALLAPLLPYLDELRGDAAPDNRFTLSIARQPEPGLPAGAEPTIDGPLPEGGRGQLLAENDGTRWFAVPGEIALRVAPDKAAATIAVRPGREALIAASAGMHLIETALRHGGQYLLHAAALRLPGTSDAFLLFAPSGAGKTTTSLALALDGFGLLTDDASIVAPGATGHRVWGLPRAFKVHRRTAAMLPRIGALLSDKWNKDDEQALTQRALRSIVDVDPPRPRTLVAAVVLGPRVAGDHVMRAIRRSEALVHLAADNVSSAPCGVLPDHLQRFESMSRIVAGVGAYELRVGSNLPTLGRALTSALM